MGQGTISAITMEDQRLMGMRWTSRSQPGLMKESTATEVTWTSQPREVTFPSVNVPGIPPEADNDDKM